MSLNPLSCTLLHYLGYVNGISQMIVLDIERQFYKIKVRIQNVVALYVFPIYTALSPDISHSSVYLLWFIRKSLILINQIRLQLSHKHLLCELNIQCIPLEIENSHPLPGDKQSPPSSNLSLFPSKTEKITTFSSSHIITQGVEKMSFCLSKAFE